MSGGGTRFELDQVGAGFLLNTSAFGAQKLNDARNEGRGPPAFALLASNRLG
jgi:hypothetical protein